MLTCSTEGSMMFMSSYKGCYDAHAIVTHVV